MLVQVSSAWRSTRPGASLIAATLSSSVAVAQTGFHLQAFWIGAAMWCVTAFGFVINDILDYNKDKEAGVNRPIPMDELSRSNAAFIALLLLSLAFIISATLELGGWILAATVLALILYTPATRHVTLLKGLYVAALCIAPLCYAAVVVRAKYSLVLYGTLAVFIFGRETLMDANEMDGDRKAGLVTLAAAIGQSFSRWMGACLMAASLAWLTLVTVTHVGKTAAALSFVLVVLVLIWPHMHEDKRIALSRIPMLAAAIAIAFG